MIGKLALVKRVAAKVCIGIVWLLACVGVNAHDTDIVVPDDTAITLKSLNTKDAYLPELVTFIDDLLFFAQDVTVLTEVEDGPLFDPEHMEIWMPGSFSDSIAEYFDSEDAPIGDVYFHTLVHEVGHVLFAQYDLPLLAREEDAADALANVLLLEYACLLYTSPSPRDKRQSRMPSSA